jgi:lipid A 3-O-deacylase
MRLRIGGAAAAALALTLLVAPRTARADGAGMLALGLGAYDLRRDTEPQLRVEYRFAPSFLWLLKPLVGAFVAGDGTFFGYAGARIELALTDHLVLVGDAGAGYWRRGRGLDLGDAFEFKTGAECAYRFDDESRLGIAFDHISNAGIAKLNPGVESLLLVYSFPLGGPR